MTVNKLEPGCYLDSNRGHYQSVDLIEMAIGLGYEDKTLTNEQLYALCEAYRNDEPEILFHTKDNSPLYLTNDTFSISECVYETQEDIETWINDNLVPEGYWFGHHPDLGDIGVWGIEDE